MGVFIEDLDGIHFRPPGEGGGGGGGQGGDPDGNPYPMGSPEWAEWIRTHGGGSGGGQTADWRAYLHMTGMPPDVIARIEQIFRETDDPQQAAMLAMAFIRGTDWYQATFPGIEDGITKGLFGDEQGYRAYVSQVGVYYQQYFGRPPSTQEITNYITAGWDVGYVAKTFEGQAFVAANRNDIEYLAGNFGEGELDESQLQTYGKQEVGLGSVLGAQLERTLRNAQNVMQGMFGGQLASGALSLGASGLSQPSLSKKPGTPDYAA